MSEEQQSTDEMAELRKILSAEMDKNKELTGEIVKLRRALEELKAFTNSADIEVLVNAVLGVKNG